MTIEDQLHLVPTTLLQQKQPAESPTIPVSLISLADKSDRRELLLERGIPKAWVSHFWSATDFRTATPSAVEKFADQAAALKQLGRHLTPAEVGCAVSHRRAAEWLATSDYDLMLILEDDVIPTSPSFLDVVLGVCLLLLNHAREDHSFICHLGPREEQAAQAISRTVHSRSSDRSRTNPTILLHADPIKTLWRAHAYLISKAAAKRAADRGTAISTVADDWSGKRRTGLIDEIFFCGTAVFSQDELIPSTVDKAFPHPDPQCELDATRKFARHVYRQLRHFVLRSQARLLQRIPRLIG
jgi:glycosyl transferase family 25